MKELNEIRGRP